MFSLTHFYYIFFFFNDTATTEIYTLSLHDALPILDLNVGGVFVHGSMLAALRRKVKGQLDMGVMRNAHGSAGGCPGILRGWNRAKTPPLPRRPTPSRCVICVPSWPSPRS